MNKILKNRQKINKIIKKYVAFFNCRNISNPDNQTDFNDAQ